MRNIFNLFAALLFTCCYYQNVVDLGNQSKSISFLDDIHITDSSITIAWKTENIPSGDPVYISVYQSNERTQNHYVSNDKVFLL